MEKIAVLGLGYVGLGLVVSLSKTFQVTGYDILEKRIQELRDHHDKNLLLSKACLAESSAVFTADIQDIAEASVYIVTVSTPAYYYLVPDLEPLIKATRSLSSLIKKNDLIIFESTVYPGTVEEELIPVMEEITTMQAGVDFYVGYSPERINPNDDVHTLKTVPKIIAAQNDSALERMKQVYGACCDEVYPVSSIKTAEAVKILENTQRDINIAIMNEFAEIMHTMHLNMHEILQAAQTKWSFLPFKPGLVGGHCIAVDPLYLAFKAKQEGVRSNLTMTARQINDDMTHFIRHALSHLMLQHRLGIEESTIGIFGLTYKENVPDFRNSLSLKLMKELRKAGFHMKVHDPLADPEILRKKYQIELQNFDEMNQLSVAVILNAHRFYAESGIERFMSLFKDKVILMDIPNLFIDDATGYQDMVYWSL